jgi:4-amino-4-deoxy-L-arabinose transferase-like glycosyltransferase
LPPSIRTDFTMRLLAKICLRPSMPADRPATTRTIPRVADYALLLIAAAALTLPNLGSPSLWDVDEGVNAEAAREMHEAGTWVIPTFNFELRTAKPVMLYWLQRASYAAWGVSEWSARLPSVLASWLTILLTYELARRMFGRGTGMLAAVVLGTAIEFCILAHAATPDATLLLFTVLAFYLFWIGHEDGRRSWWLPMAAACGLAMLTKGPVGVALPGLVAFAYFAWNRELSRLWDRRLIWGIAVFALVAGPWYGLVTAETRGAWAKAFFLNENWNRALTSMEDHRGPIFYHAAALLVLFAPWSVFLIPALWYGFRAARPNANRGERFLLCWIGAYLVFFSLVRTKLPNYVLPLYPALAILTARFLVRWRDGELTLPKWLMPAATGGMALVAVAIAGGLLAAGGTLQVGSMRTFPGLEHWAVLGLVPLTGAIVMAWRLRAGNRAGFVSAATGTSLLLTTLIAAFPALTMDRYKAPRELTRACGLPDSTRDIRLAGFDWFQPSIVFYSGREVVKLPSPGKAVEFLAAPTPAFLFVSENTWNAWRDGQAIPAYRVVARCFDFYRNCYVLAISNEPLRPE